MTDLDDWPDPTKYTAGPLTVYRSNAGFGTEINMGRRVQWRTRKGTTRMWPRVDLRGGDENCNRAVVVVLWPLGCLTVWWEPRWRTAVDGPCEDCRGFFRSEGLCERCGSRPCWCGELREAS